MSCIMSSQCLDVERCKLHLFKRESEKHIPFMTPNDDDNDDFERQKEFYPTCITLAKVAPRILCAQLERVTNID